MKKFLLNALLVSMSIMVVGCGTGKKSESSPASGKVDYGESDFVKISSPTNQLGFDIFPTIDANEDGNTFISPTSLFMALSMAYNGAGGSTKDEMADVMHVADMNRDELSKANASMMARLRGTSDQIQLSIANSIWIKKEFHFKKEFAQTNREYFDATSQEIDMNDATSVKSINEWVEKKTNGKITDMVDSSLDPNAIAILLNAIYFKGDWTHTFDKQLTQSQPFYMEDGTTNQVPLMVLTEELAYLENEYFQAVKLPYGDGDMSMSVFLPKQGTNLSVFQKNLTNDNWKKWNSEFQMKNGTIMLPKFRIDYEITLNDTLRELGMPSAFLQDVADFSDVAENTRLHISEVKQKTFIDVNEEGTEAAASTSVKLSDESASVGQFQMVVNRPFFISITDNESESIVFMGSIFNPVQ